MNTLLIFFCFSLLYSTTSTSSRPSAAASNATNDNSTLISFRRYYSDYTNSESVEQDTSKTTSLPKKQRRAATARKDRIWPHGVIPYVVAANFSGEHRNLFHRAMRHWENFTCISFVPKEPHHKHYIMFTVDKCGCCSYVGRRGDGPQAISIGKNCDKFGIVVHELGHVVGFWHEHTRPDRDQYVDIFYKNVLTDQHYNFEMSKAEEVNSLGEPYDFGSIMHYSRDTFSRGTFLDTILPKTNSGYRAEIGQRVQLSEGDIRQTKKLYKCPACGGSMLGDSSDIELKDIGSTCVWRIIAAEGQTIFLNISGGFLPEPSIACSAEMENFIIVRDGYSPKSSILDKFCGGSSDYHTLVSTGSRMFLEVRTKSKAMVPPISIGTYYSICGGPIHSENGIIQSPRYPEAYPPNADCVWTIKMPEGYQVAVEIIYFHLEQHKDCIYDRVLLWEGSENSKPLANLCGIIENRQIVTTYSNQMAVRFISDNSVQKFGFELRFTKELDECQSGSHNCEQRCLNTVGAYSCDCSVGYSLRPDGRTCESTCGGFLRSSSGSFASPNFPEHYPPSKNCVWEIEAEEGYQIFLNFTKFNVEGMKTECAYDYVQIGKSERLCGEYENPLLFTSTTNRVRVEFASDSSVERSGFSAHFIADLDECQHDNADCEHICQNRLGFYVCQCNPGFVLAADGHNCKEGGCTFELNEPHGEISSPNYPNEYPKGQNCTWHFVTTPGHRLTITFNSFQIEEHSQCQYDAVVVHDGGNSQSPVTGVFCGLAVPPVLMSSTNELFLAFSSDSSVSRKGFTASYTSVCGGSLKATDAPGHIYSHATFSDSKYGKNQDCHWLISARTANRGVRLEFTTFAVEGEGSCPYDYVEVYDETEEIQDKLFGRFCGDSLPVVITSTGSDLLLVLHTDDTEEEKGFVAEYREALKSRDSPRSVANRLAAQRQRPIGELINNPS